MSQKDVLLKAKMSSEETGISIKHTICDLCTPGPHCGVDAYVKDGKIIKIEGTKGFPGSNGKLCAKGAAGREYEYNPERLTNPMKRIGERGSGRFEPITWDEAFDICSDRLNSIKKQYGPEAVAWVCGYSKWFRPWLHRLTHSFGSLNYITESSTCHCSEVMSFCSIYGCFMVGNIPNAKIVIAWGSNGFINSFPLGKSLMMLKENGGKIVTIDPRYTQTAQKLADIYVRPKIGTDGYLANAMANYIIENNYTDNEFIEKYVHGFNEYKEMVKEYTLEKAESVTGVPKDTIIKVAELFVSEKNSLIISGSGLTHHIDGFNMHRAIMSLMVITGKVDRPGTIRPVNETICHSSGGFISHEKEFINDVRPESCKPPIGMDRFPLWFDFIPEAHGMNFVKQIKSGTPYPIKAMAAFGVNHKMYPDSKQFLETLKKLDFIMATDIFKTDLCDYADIVLPVKTSYERSEVKCYGDRFVNWTEPVVEPVGDCKDDVEIMAELSKRMGLGDNLLEEGYDAGAKFILRESGISDWEAVKKSPLPTEAPNSRPYKFGTYLDSQKNTPSGKIELYSEVITKYGNKGLNPLPVCADNVGDIDINEYPFTLMTGARIPSGIHSRTTRLSWLRCLTNDPALRINPKDAKNLGIKDTDKVRVTTPVCSIITNVVITEEYNVGEVGMYHGFDEANANDLLSIDHLDPYSGFPGYKQLNCKVEKL